MTFRMSFVKAEQYICMQNSHTNSVLNRIMNINMGISKSLDLVKVHKVICLYRKQFLVCILVSIRNKICGDIALPILFRCVHYVDISISTKHFPLSLCNLFTFKKKTLQKLIQIYNSYTNLLDLLVNLSENIQ